MESELYKVIGGYNSGEYTHQILENYYETYKEAKDCLACPYPFDWMRYDVIEDNAENRAKVLQTSLKYEEIAKQVKKDIEGFNKYRYKPSEHPYKASKVDGVGQGSLRGH